MVDNKLVKNNKEMPRKMKGKTYKNLGKAVGAMVFGVFCLTVGSQMGADEAHASSIFVDSGSSEGVPTDCDAPNGYQSICSNGMGGASWKIFKIGTPSGPSTVNTGIITGQETMGTISSKCNAIGAAWFASFGWEGMSTWNSGVDTHLEERHTVAPIIHPDFQGGVQIGPTNYGEGVIAGAEYNNVGATFGSAVAWKQAGLPDNVRLTREAATEMNCLARYYGGYIDEEGLQSCDESALDGIGYFCWAPDWDGTTTTDDENHHDENQCTYPRDYCNGKCDCPPEERKELVVRVVGDDKTVKDKCYGRTEDVSSDSVELEAEQTIAMGDAPTVSYTLNRAKYEADGWTFAEPSIENPKGQATSFDGSTFQADVSNGRVIVTFRFTREQVLESDVPCDPQCDPWTPQEYKDSTEWDANTAVRIGVKRDVEYGENKTPDWYHDGEETEGLKNGVVYAKPTDTIQFKYCYYPGVERAADKTVTDHNEDAEEPEQLPGNVNEQNNVEFKDYPEWEKNGYEAWEDGGDTGQEAGFRPTSEYYKVDNKGYATEAAEPASDEPLIGTLPGGPLAQGQSSDGDDNRIYTIQPFIDQRVDIIKRTEAEMADKLNPGDTIQGHIEATQDGEIGATKIHREKEDKVHEWECNATEGDQEGGGGDSEETPKCTHDEEFYRNEANAESKADTATVIIPFNFKNSASAKVAPNGDCSSDGDPEGEIYSGGTVTVCDPTITIGTRPNNEIGDEYATDIIEAGKARVIAFLSATNNVEPGAGSVWKAAVTDSDDYGNEADGNGYIWKSTEEVCSGSLFNAKFDVCKYVEMIDGKLNYTAAMDGVTYHFNGGGFETSQIGGEMSTKASYDVFDEAAGNYFCVASAVYPFSVKNDTDTDKDGDQSWYVSKPSCAKIYKKPVFQVWGSGIYTGGDAVTYTTEKTNVLSHDSKRDNSVGMSMGGDYIPWQPYESSAQRTTFGSWVELSETLLGSSSNETLFASGAGTGFSNGGIEQGNATSTWTSGTSSSLGSVNDTNNLSTYVGDKPAFSMGFPVGFNGTSGSTTVCKRSPMSIGNLTCNSGSVGGFLPSNELNDALAYQASDLVAMFDSEAAATGKYAYIENGSLANDYTEPLAAMSGNVVPSVGRGQTIVQRHEGVLHIASDIKLEVTTGLTKLSEIGKYIIFATDAINIDCSVSRIDAILITGGVVNTCANASGNTPEADSAERSHQFVLNGAIISGGLKLPRTYGASTGEWSGTPAELINYDTSLYLWSNAQAESSESGQVTNTAGTTTGVSSGTSEAAVRELAPRY